MIQCTSIPLLKGPNELGVIDCASGDFVDFMALKLTLDDDGQDYLSDDGNVGGGLLGLGYGSDDDDEWASGGEGIGERERKKRAATASKQQRPRQAPSICSLRVSPDGIKVLHTVSATSW